jgi:hypothetical protein
MSEIPQILKRKTQKETMLKAMRENVEPRFARHE